MLAAAAAFGLQLFPTRGEAEHRPALAHRARSLSVPIADLVLTFEERILSERTDSPAVAVQQIVLSLQKWVLSNGQLPPVAVIGNGGTVGGCNKTNKDRNPEPTPPDHRSSERFTLPEVSLVRCCL
jgi:hypothetical protein